MSFISGKPEIRELQKKKISLVQEFQSKETMINENLIQSISNASAIVAYKFISYEVNIDSALFQLSKSMKIFYPRIEGDTLQFILPEAWISGKFRVFEPVGTQRIEPGNADFCIIPALGFNQWGYRLGRGGGFYDRKFQGLAQNKILGVGFSEVFPVDFQEEAHDIRISRLITENGLIFFEN